MRLSLNQRKPVSQYRAKGLELSIKAAISLCLILTTLFYVPTVQAVSDPRNTPNNKFGIHIISATPDEASPAASLVNSTGGDWGYITFVIKDSDRDTNKWQQFFDYLRVKHLIPIVRLATHPEGSLWKVPTDNEESNWVNFLDSLNWPTKNRYVVIYNEPNQGSEWGGSVDPTSYAKVLDKIITALKSKNQDFFILNAGLDASAPEKQPLFEDESNFLSDMEKAVPGIFEKLDGWVSHSYPNPGFIGSPNAFGRGTVRTWAWEMEVLQKLGVKKDLPVFITETGWQHAEGINYNPYLPSAETVGAYFKQAFQSAWNDGKIVAVTPFLLSYQDPPFDHFSFKKLDSNRSDQVLGVSSSDDLNQKYYPTFLSLAEISKNSGHPIQLSQGKLVKGEVYSSVVSGESYSIPLTFENIGESIWNDGSKVSLMVLEGMQTLGIQQIDLPIDTKIAPKQSYTFNLKIKAPSSGTFRVRLQLFSDSKEFDQPPLNYTVTVKPPVSIQILESLKWKQDFSGNYILQVNSDVFNQQYPIHLDKTGESQKLEIKNLIPDHLFQFTLLRPFYKSKSLEVKVESGENKINFGELQPDILSALLHPAELLKLLPFSK